MIAVGDWVPADRFSLEPNALATATNTAGNVALTAGPGAGKTEVLAQRADFLLRTGSCRYPRRILAISFKVDASQNLRARVRQRCGPELAARLDSHTFHAFAKRIIDRFRPVLTGADALDADYSVGTQRIHRRVITFAEMVPLATTIVQASLITRNAIRQTYSHVFLDEFQDCTEAQYQLIRACFEGTTARLTAVGDTKQRIMGWAGALEGIFQAYATDFAAAPLNLYQNFRSKPRLRRMQNAMVRVMDPPAALEDAEIIGDEGEIVTWRFSDDVEEARELAKAAKVWVEQEGIEPSDIAILVSKQQNLYCQQLKVALEGDEVPFRDEDRVQELTSEPVASLIVNFLIVVYEDSRPDAYRRLMELVTFNHRFDEEREFQARSQWHRFVLESKRRLTQGLLDLTAEEGLAALVGELLETIGRDTLVALSFDYRHGGRLDQVVSDTVARLHELLKPGEDPAAALARFSGDRAVRIMSIHKSKGLEFDTVVLLGVENQMFWGNKDDERAAFFVGISRAKRRLVLTIAKRRERPEGARHWHTNRTEQEEFVQYASPYV